MTKKQRELQAKKKKMLRAVALAVLLGGAGAVGVHHYSGRPQMTVSGSFATAKGGAPARPAPAPPRLVPASPPWPLPATRPLSRPVPNTASAGPVSHDMGEVADFLAGLIAVYLPEVLKQARDLVNTQITRNTRRGIDTLRKGGWLSDDEINHWAVKIRPQAAAQKVMLYTSFITAWNNKNTISGHAKAQRESTNFKTVAPASSVLPINQNNANSHWYVLQYRPSSGWLVYDSLRVSPPANYAPDLRRAAFALGVAEGQPATFVPNWPQQADGSSCGPMSVLAMMVAGLGFAVPQESCNFLQKQVRILMACELITHPP